MRYFQHKWPAVLLWPLSQIYGAVVQHRNRAYERGKGRINRLDVPVISIGNITVGGTGKTPTTLYLAHWLQARAKKVCILSRGYGRTSSGTVLVSDGERIHANAQEGGDEPVMMARQAPGVAVVVDANRHRGGAWACRQLHAEVILLDDGFQHRQLHRDVDVVTFKGKETFGNGWLLPAGPLREPLHNLARADLFWFNEVRAADLKIGFVRPSIEARIVAQGLRNETAPASGKAGSRRAIVFCGLAHPYGFVQTVQSQGIDVRHWRSFKDHHRYRQRDIEELESVKTHYRADMIITTLKDWVKIAPVFDLPPYWYCLEITIQPEDVRSADTLLSNLCSGIL